MCQILMVTNTRTLTDEGRKLLVNCVKKEITKSNRDGFGFAGVTNSNKYYGFKTVDYNIQYEPDVLNTTIKSGYVKTNRFTYFGNHDNQSENAMIFHGRTSTNKAGLLNAHPVMINGTCLIHNGVVSSEENIKQVLDTDTELLCYTIPKQGTIKNKIKNMKAKLEETISGYYAFFNLNTDGSVLVVKDDIASLYITEIKEHDFKIIGTTVSLIENVCNEMEWEHGSVYELENNKIFTIGPDNNIENLTNLEPLGYSYNESQYSNLSLGKSLNSYDGYRVYDPNQSILDNDPIDIEKKLYNGF